MRPGAAESLEQGAATTRDTEIAMNRHATSIAVALILVGAMPVPPVAFAQLATFVARQGDQLVEGDKPFRFISFNIPNLQLVEDNFAPGAETPWRWPNEFELIDALESVRQMGGTVVRTYVLSVRRETGDIGEHVYVRGPGDFNEDAFRALDLAIEIAGKKGVRLVIPLVDNWKWQGGRAEYAGFRGKRADDCWTDEQVIGDFETTIRFVLGRVNTRTGVAYKDDPAILAWETGNELDSPPAWTRRIAALIKSLDPNHLVVDGNSLHGVRQESLDDPNLDVITTHHYPGPSGTNYVPAIRAAREACRGKKPYFVGEFGFAPLAEIERTYDAVIAEGVTGALLWSLRFHHRDGGFYWHDEPAGGRLYKAYHWPGFDSGAAYEERQVLELTRRQAFEIRGLTAPPIEPPAPPALLPIEDVAAISWQGSAGAQDYVVERAIAPPPQPAREGIGEGFDEPLIDASAPVNPAADANPSPSPSLQGRGISQWHVVGEPIDDASVQYRPLFQDAWAEPGQSYYYRVIARNSGGASEPSNAIGPVAVAHRTLVDECVDAALAASTSVGVEPSRGQDRRRREDVHRLAVPAGGAVVYGVAESIKQWRAIVFRDDGSPRLTADYLSDGREWTPATFHQQSSGASAGDYDYLQQVIVMSTDAANGARFLRLTAQGDEKAGNAAPALELSRVEIRYGGY
jgi:hypothetical protein